MVWYVHTHSHIQFIWECTGVMHDHCNDMVYLLADIAVCDTEPVTVA